MKHLSLEGVGGLSYTNLPPRGVARGAREGRKNGTAKSPPAVPGREIISRSDTESDDREPPSQRCGRRTHDRHRRPHQTVRPVHGGRPHRLFRQPRRGARLSRAERRRQIHNHEDDHRLPRAERRSGACLRPRHRDLHARCAARNRLPAGRRARLWRHDGARFPHLHRACAPFERCRGRQGNRPGRRGDGAGWRAGAADRHALQGFSPPRRSCAGDPAQPAGADHGRADRRSRSEPEVRGAQAYRPHGCRKGDCHLDAYSRGSGCDLHPRTHHRPRSRGRGRDARRPDGAVALSQRGLAHAWRPDDRRRRRSASQHSGDCQYRSHTSRRGDNLHALPRTRARKRHAARRCRGAYRTGRELARARALWRAGQ